MTSYACCSFRTVILVLSLCGIVGCSAPVIKGTDMPQLQTGSPLKSVRPSIFVLKPLTDIRAGVTDPLVIDPFSKMTLDQPPIEAVAAAIRKELERNSHTCIDYTERQKADFIIEGTVYKYSLRFENTIKRIRRTANVAVKLTISNTSTDGALFIKSYEGEISDEPFLPGPGMKQLVIQAQSKMLQEFSTDPELIAFLKK
jgi:hypothetical protein